MLNKKSNNTKLIMETWRRFINEGEVETEAETKQENVPQGAWIIRAMTRAGEEYVVKESKFPKLYDTNPVGKGPDGFMIYNVKPEVRNGIVIKDSILDEEDNLKEKLENKFSGQTVSQEEMHKWLRENAKTVDVKKQSQVFAKQAEGGETVETRVEKAGGVIMEFVASWGSTMPVKANDVLIINDKEVYRIARAEFDQTYEFTS
jgi:hypothetical protein